MDDYLDEHGLRQQELFARLLQSLIELSETGSANVLDAAQRENENAMAELAECKERDHWPTGFESLRKYDHL